MINNVEADVCIVVEGSYPYVPGGVSSWIHQLLESQSEKTFHIVSIVAPTQNLKDLRYDLPKNVVGLHNIILQDLPATPGLSSRTERREFYKKLEKKLFAFLVKGGQGTFQELLELFEQYPKACSKEMLMNSQESWKILLKFYQGYMNAASFIDFFWAWRNLFSSLYSILIADVPKARLYHAICTGYAGVFMAKAHLKYQAPCLLTEHGIYTNERQIEITLADWIEYQKNFSLQMGKTQIDLDMKDFWMYTFENYSKICYGCCDEIITLFNGNKTLQIANGADPKKLRVIPNGIDYDTFSQIERDEDHPPTIALIGRVVPIKDVHTFIQACIMVKDKIPDLKAFVMGPTDEDKDYYAECMETVKYANMEENIIFTGKVNLKDYLPIVDLSVLTSLSEAQPLVILEAGAAGIPSVSTDVGSCRELIYGKPEEVGEDNIVRGGDVVDVGSPQGVAEAIIKLLTDKDDLNQCREVIKSRVYHEYNKTKIDITYRELYDKHLQKNKPQEAA